MHGKTARIVKKAVALALSAALVAPTLVTAGSDSFAKAKFAIKNPVLNGGSLVLKKGKSQKLKISGGKAKFKSSNKKIVKVSNKGVVKAVKASKKPVNITIQSGKKKIILKVIVGTPISSVKCSSWTLTTRTTTDNSNSMKAEDHDVKTKQSGNNMVLATEIVDEAADTKVTQLGKANLTFSPKKPSVKKMKWISKDDSVVKVNQNGVIVPSNEITEEKSAVVVGKTMDGSNKSVKVNVTIKISPKGATATPNYEKEIKIVESPAAIVENFESYDVGTNWMDAKDAKGNSIGGYTAGGYTDSGKMTVVADPENPANKVLKVEFNGSQQAYDFAPVFHVKLPAGKKLDSYAAIRLKSRVNAVGSGGMPDAQYKKIYAYFDALNQIKPEDYFATSNFDGTDPKTATDQKLRFGEKISMAEGEDTTYNVPDNLEYAKAQNLAIQDENTIKISGTKKYNNKNFPQYYDEYGSKDDKTAVCPGFMEGDSSAEKPCGFQQNTLMLDKTRIAGASIQETPKPKEDSVTPLLDRTEFDMVIGSTYSGKKELAPDAYTLTLYLDDIELIRAFVPLTGLQFVNPAKRVVFGKKVKLNVAYAPKNTTQREVVYTSSDETLAKVDDKGYVTANNDDKAGDVIITATCKDNPAITTQCTIKVGGATYETQDYDILANGAVILPKGDITETTKVASSSEGSTIENGVLNLKFSQVNNDIVAVDLGKAIDLNNYRGLELNGVAPGQITIEFYSDGFDMSYTKDNGNPNDWWDSAMSAGHTYPYFLGSTTWRYEKGGWDEFMAEENGKSQGSGDEKWYQPTEELQRFSFDTLGEECNGDWGAVRYLVFKANKQPVRTAAQEFQKDPVATDKYIPIDYSITTLKFITDEFIEARTNGFYEIDTTKNEIKEDSKDDVTAFYADKISDANPVEKRDQSVNISNMKYLRVGVKDEVTSVKVSLVEEGKKAADAVVIGETSEFPVVTADKKDVTKDAEKSGKRDIYFAIDKDAIKGIDLKKIDKILVETKGGKATSLGLTPGYISASGKTKKYEVTFEDGKYVTRTVVERKIKDEAGNPAQKGKDWVAYGTEE